MTASLCPECLPIQDKLDEFVFNALNDDHWSCLAVWARQNDGNLFYAVIHGLFRDPQDACTPVTRELDILVPLLNLTKEEVIRFLERKRAGGLGGLNRSIVSYDAIEALFRYDLMSPVDFWERFADVLSTDDRYQVMVDGYLPTKDSIIDAQRYIDEVLNGNFDINVGYLVKYTALISCYRRATRERRECHWRAFWAALFFNSFSSRYLKKKYAPGSHEMRIAQTRFETGDYQV